ncbi:MAG: sensor histidine kinase [Muribaculaceae bacterium]
MKNILIFAGLGLFSYYLIINFTDISPQVAYVFYSHGALIYTVIAFSLLGMATMGISEWVNRRYIQKSEIKWHFLLVNLLMAALFFGLNYSLCVVAKILAHVQPVWALSGSGWRLLMVVWTAEMVIIALLLSNRTLMANQRLKQEAARLQIENSKAKYDALQHQLNPHFLFNSLNTLIAEIQYNPENAVKFTRHLSKVYRYVLQCQSRHLVSLGEELAFAESYVFLHKVRLGDCLNCKIDIPDELRERAIPPLTLQLLVENVIKHNSVSPSKPMTIGICASGDTMTVSNPISPKRNASESQPGIGLENLASRCRLACDRDIEISKNDNMFIVTIPLIK